MTVIEALGHAVGWTCAGWAIGFLVWIVIGGGM